MVEHTRKPDPPFEAVLEQMLARCLLTIERRIAGIIQAKLQLTSKISFAICFIFFWQFNKDISDSFSLEVRPTDIVNHDVSCLVRRGRSAENAPQGFKGRSRQPEATTAIPSPQKARQPQ